MPRRKLPPRKKLPRGIGIMSRGAPFFTAAPVTAMPIIRGRAEDAARCRAETPRPLTGNGSLRTHEQSFLTGSKTAERHPQEPSKRSKPGFDGFEGDQGCCFSGNERPTSAKNATTTYPQTSLRPQGR